MAVRRGFREWGQLWGLGALCRMELAGALGLLVSGIQWALGNMPVPAILELSSESARQFPKEKPTGFLRLVG